MLLVEETLQKLFLMDLSMALRKLVGELVRTEKQSPKDFCIMVVMPLLMESNMAQLHMIRTGRKMVVHVDLHDMMSRNY